MQRRKANKLDNTGLGFLIGFLLPLVFFVIVYFVKSSGNTFTQYIQYLNQLNVLVKLGSLCVFINSFVFLGFLKLKYERTARGILGATIIYAFVVLISRLF